MRIVQDKFCCGCQRDHQTLFEIEKDRFRCVDCIITENPDKLAEIYVHMK